MNKNLKLVVGKTYANREGERVTIGHSDCDGSRLRFFERSGMGYVYLLNGECPGVYRKDLVSDWVEPDPHAKVRAAFEAGTQIEWREDDLDQWYPACQPLFYPEYQYRVKPEPTPAPKPRPFADVIKAWADGAEVQWRNAGYSPEWRDIDAGTFFESNEYRVKPQAATPDEPTNIVRWMSLAKISGKPHAGLPHKRREVAEANFRTSLMGILRLELDADTGDVISCVKENV